MPIVGESVPSTTADASFAELLARLREITDRYPVVARATVVGKALTMSAGAEQRHEILLDRLARLPDEPWEVDEDAPGRTLDELAGQFAALQLEVHVKARKPGCAALAISISDESGVRPLDHVVRHVRVVDEHGEGPDCEVGDFAALQAGLDSTLSTWGAPDADAGLHLFELEMEGPKTAAFYVERGGAHHAWTLNLSLSDHLKDRENLEARIEKARERASHGASHTYGGAGRALADLIFSADPLYSEDPEAAKAAREALRALAAGADTTPTLLARFQGKGSGGRRGPVHFVPLGLLGARGADRELDKPVRVVQPLPKEDYLEKGCIESWVFAVSDELEGPSVPVPPELKESESWLGATFVALKNWLGVGSPEEPDSPGAADALPPVSAMASIGEGLVVAAHYAGGRMRYRHAEEPLQTHKIKREFGSGSLRVLALCGAGAPDPVEQQLLDWLNRSGLDAAVLSLFSLPADFGKAFAIEFALAAERARADDRAATLAELFDEAAAQTSVRLDREMGIGVGDMALELVVVGNQELALCKE